MKRCSERPWPVLTIPTACHSNRLRTRSITSAWKPRLQWPLCPRASSPEPDSCRTLKYRRVDEISSTRGPGSYVRSTATNLRLTDGPLLGCPGGGCTGHVVTRWVRGMRAVWVVGIKPTTTTRATMGGLTAGQYACLPHPQVYGISLGETETCGRMSYACLPACLYSTGNASKLLNSDRIAAILASSKSILPTWCLLSGS